MKEKLFLKRFKILGLFGLYNVDIPFDSNVNIFVGENGLGKTTILNALNYVIQGDSESLNLINFDSIELVLGNNVKIVIKHDKLNYNEFIYNKNYISHYYYDEDSNIVKKIMLELLKETSGDLSFEKDSKEKIFEKILKKYKFDFSTTIIDRIYNNYLKNEKYISELKKSWEYRIHEYMKEYSQVIYLPTYRRIEEDFNNFVDNVHDKEYYRKIKIKNNFSYLQFGMDDVQELINDACITLKNNTNEGFKSMTKNLLTNYIAIEKNVEKFNYDKFDSSKIEIVFSRLADKIDENIKDEIISMVENKKSNKEDKYSKYLLSIINELNNIYEKNKQIDDNIENFKNVCNKYLVNKEIRYDKFKIECKVEQNRGNSEIYLKNLSSGEKQILSLFSKLYLNMDGNNVILFDEPELSLSLIWQKSLIPDILETKKCDFIMVITHSPFIFDNEFRYNTKDIKEFIEYME